ncbi:MAG TPA: flagellar hook-basal body complex protein FliE [Verrucomicrobiae bacterium]|nr:flagellar hook-basal body complex protein FliE [Verrucomicrobiae bacterium]
MLPISNIPSALPIQALRQMQEAAEAGRLPGADAASSIGRISDPIQTADGDNSFGSLFGRLVEDVNAKQNASAEAVQSLQSGGNVSLHQAVIAMEEASVSFQLMVEVRNKLLEAYQEVMRMQM